MAGYLPDEASADAFADGWYRTGDVGWLEAEGWVHLTDRSKEMIKVSGFQVAPAEVEAVLLGHPAVLDCAVFGVADERAGEVPAAAVALDPDLPVAEGELEALVADSLATYKRLHYLVVVDEIPRLPSGKVLRRTLAGRVVGPAAGGAERGLMDVRLSPEQQALQDSAARIVDQLGPHAVGDLGDPERTAKLDAAVTGAGWRELRTAAADGAPAGLGGGGWASWPRCWAGGWPTCRSSDPPWPVSCGGWPRPRPVPRPRPWCSPPTSRRWPGSPAAGRPPAWPSTCRAPHGPCCWPRRPAVSSWPRWSWARRGGRRSHPTVERRSTRRWWRHPCPGRPDRSSDEALDRWTALGLSVACADLVGTMDGAVGLATAYAAERHQYGAAIGSFQAVQHLLADAHVLTEGARSVTLHASWAVDELPAADALSAAAVAKAYCARAARQVCETAIQVHGGLGNTWECLAHVYLRRSLLAGDLLGDGRGQPDPRAAPSGYRG